MTTVSVNNFIWNLYFMCVCEKFNIFNHKYDYIFYMLFLYNSCTIYHKYIFIIIIYLFIIIISDGNKESVSVINFMCYLY